MSNELYTIVVSGEKLYFTKDQIFSDPGNYFATYFFGEFAEGTQGTRELHLQKDIQLFKLIQAHLRGYRILPLADAVIPSYMTKEVALINLFLDAQYYGLERLEERIRREKPNIADLASETPTDPQPPEATLPKRYKFAKFDRSLGAWRDWRITDTTPEGYRMRLSLATAPGKILMNRNLNCPGFTQLISWMDNPGDLHCIYALLESDPV